MKSAVLGAAVRDGLGKRHHALGAAHGAEDPVDGMLVVWQRVEDLSELVCVVGIYKAGIHGRMGGRCPCGVEEDEDHDGLGGLNLELRMKLI